MAPKKQKQKNIVPHPQVSSLSDSDNDDSIPSLASDSDSGGDSSDDDNVPNMTSDDSDSEEIVKPKRKSSRRLLCADEEEDEDADDDAGSEEDDEDDERDSGMVVYSYIRRGCASVYCISKLSLTILTYSNDYTGCLSLQAKTPLPLPLCFFCTSVSKIKKRSLSLL